jgi:hypothetical protein
VIGGAIILIVVGLALGIFFPLLFIVTGVGVALLIVGLVRGARETRETVDANRVE